MSPGDRFEQLLAIMARLRAPGGCPWDREQTLATLKPFLIEEAYEVLEAIDTDDGESLGEELGDLLLQIVFISQIASESGTFTIERPIEAISSKLLRRHPHVFGDSSVRDAEEVKQRWDAIKRHERAERSEVSAGLLGTVPRALPALAEAQQITTRAARAGFDWKQIEDVLWKFQEELEELDQARRSGDRDRLEDELGDLLLTIVNLSRFLELDAEQALRRSNAKFRRRFGHVEQTLRQRGQDLEQATLEEMETLWQEAKAAE